MPKNIKRKVISQCADCIHEWACQAWNVGNIHNMDATNCAVYETVKQSTAYFIGFMDWQKAQELAEDEDAD